MVNFTASEVLRGGGFPTDRLASLAYRLTDVKVGDGVRVEFIALNGLEVVTHIGITRRPGGRVPPSPAERPDAENKYHEWANAYNDWRYKGIPLPDKYDPEYQQAEAAARLAAYLGDMLSRPNRLSEKERQNYRLLRTAAQKEAADFTARTGRNLYSGPPKPRVKPIPLAKD